jgi:hypothetical protein
LLAEPETLVHFRNYFERNLVNMLRIVLQHLPADPQLFPDPVLLENMRLALGSTEFTPLTGAPSEDILESTTRILGQLMDLTDELTHPAVDWQVLAQRLPNADHSILRFGRSLLAELRQDVMSLRVAQITRIGTCGIVEVACQLTVSSTPSLPKEISVTLVDVGGPRSERRRWVHAFEGVQPIFFLAASDLFLNLVEDHRINRWAESLQLWQQIATSQWFNETYRAVVITHCDLFFEYVSRSELQECGRQQGLDPTWNFYKMLLFLIGSIAQEAPHFHVLYCLNQLDAARVFACQVHLAQLCLATPSGTPPTGIIDRPPSLRSLGLRHHARSQYYRSSTLVELCAQVLVDHQLIDIALAAYLDQIVLWQHSYFLKWYCMALLGQPLVCHLPAIIPELAHSSS